jgi:hypothetical protein
MAEFKINLIGIEGAKKIIFKSDNGKEFEKTFN